MSCCGSRFRWTASAAENIIFVKSCSAAHSVLFSDLANAMRRFFAVLFRLFFCFAMLGLLTAACALGWVYYLVTQVPCPEMAPARIAAILGRESPVCYRDGQEKIGVLFEEIHRQYLTYEQLPEQFVKAIVAAEDDQFFHHYGIDPPGIAKALLMNWQAGRIVRGGSTITQQTVKNLFGRSGRSYEAKLKEMLYALRLEQRFSKEKILEFYSNQFYVSGNGHGLGFAARYYFDKAPAELNLLETAFIAGSVKQPSHYDPFIQQDRASASQAKDRAKDRAAYVLNRMRKFEMISQTAFAAAQNEKLLFKRGKTSYALNTLMDMVRDGLSSKALSEVLAEHGIDNIVTSGAKIITTVDKSLQAETLRSLRRQLSSLDVQLRGYDRDEVRKEYKEAEGDSEISEKSFVFGTIKNIERSDPQQPRITVRFADGQPEEGLIDREGLEQMLIALVKHRRGKWAKPGKKDLADLLQRLRVGDKVYVSVREADSSFDELPLLDLERYPDKLQGAAVVMRQGAVTALAGGMDNRFFNRAVDGKRPMGSTMKPFLYAAALQLGWSPLDLLNNRRNVFAFRDAPYFPRPDHKSPFAHVSMSWAGVKSENVASVWLLHHLTDKLTPAGLLQTAAGVDMTPRDEEDYESFKARLRSSFGLHVTEDDLDQAAYQQALKKAEADFLFEGRQAEYQEWRKIPYGLHYSKFRAGIRRELQKRGLTSEEKSEYWRQLSLLGQSYPDLERSQRALERHRKYLSQLAAAAAPRFFQQEPPDETERPPGSMASDEQGRLIYTRSSSLPESWEQIDDQNLRWRLAAMFPAEQDMLWNNVLLEGRVSSGSLTIIKRQMEKERAVLAEQQPYSMEALLKLRDYRIMVGLQYLIRLARAAGVRSNLEPVLSFPLGSNVISLMDSVRMYETLVTGSRWQARLRDEPLQAEAAAPEEEKENIQAGLALIERIETQEGRVIYSRRAAARPVLDRKSSSEVGNILQNVVRWGTGRHAWENVRLPGIGGDKKKSPALPLLGKTGTANDFRNAAFLGFVPTETAPEGEALLANSGYAVGVYVGFDNNDPMKKGSLRISGSQGALPAWTRIAQALVSKEHLADRLHHETLTGSSIPLQYPDTGQLFMPVDKENGGRMRRGDAGLRQNMAPEKPAVLSHGAPGRNGGFEPERRFQPFWLLRQEAAAVAD
jgi:membrane peptidoglycan carboxypeptidase